MLGSMGRAAGRAAGQRARGRVRGRGRGRAGRGNQGGMLATGRGRAVRGGPRPQRGRGRGGNPAPRAVQDGLNAAMRAQQLASNRARDVGAIGPRLLNPSRPVNARLLGGIGPSRAVNPAARQRQLQAMGNLQRPRPMNPRAVRGGLLGRPAPRRPFTTPMGNTYFGGNMGAGGFVSSPFSRFPRGPQMVRRARGRGRGLRGLFG